MQPDPSPCAGRIRRVRERMPHWGLQSLVFLDMKNIRYLSGFSGSDGALYIGPDGQKLLVDGRYLTQARGETEGIEVSLYQNKLDGLIRVISEQRGATIGFEAAAMTVDVWTRLKERLPEAVLKPLRDEVEALRAVKDESEISRIRKAADIATNALAGVLVRLREGMTERDIAAELDFAMIKGGAEEVSFSTIVASGENSAKPHARPQNREIKAGDFVTIDFGAVFDGYHSDETCTFALGRADARQEKVYQAVKDAHDRAIEKVRAGVACSVVDEAARSWMDKQGLGDCFTHGTGHGVGLDVHEYPRLNSQSPAVLEAGMVVTVEPGAYLPGQWGVRIEDLLLVQQDGCDVITRIPKEFKIIKI